MPQNHASQSKRLLALLLVVCLLVPILCTSAYCIATIHHHCTGPDCPICEHIRTLFAILAMFEAVLQVFFLAVAYITVQRCIHRYPNYKRITPSLISLSIRMNN